MNQRQPWYMGGLTGIMRAGGMPNAVAASNAVNEGSQMDIERRQQDIQNRVAQIKMIQEDQTAGENRLQQQRQNNMEQQRLDQQQVYQQGQLAETSRARKVQEDAQRLREQMATQANQIKLRAAGLKPSINPVTGEMEIRSVDRQDLSPEELADLNTKEANAKLKDAQTALAKAREEFEKVRSNPDSPMWKQKAQQLAIAQQNADTNQQNAALRAQGQELSGERLSLIPVPDREVLAGLDQGIENISKNIIPKIHQMASMLGPIIGRVKLFEIDEAGGLGATPDEIKMALNMRRELMSEAFASGGKQLTPTEVEQFNKLIPKPTDTVQEAMIKAEDQLKFLQERKNFRMKYLSERQRHAVAGTGPPPLNTNGVVPPIQPRPGQPGAAPPAPEGPIQEWGRDDKGNLVKNPTAKKP